MLYSLAHINKTSPYRVLEYEENTACFITDSGVVYMVGFIAETNMDIPNAYQHFIETTHTFHQYFQDLREKLE